MTFTLILAAWLALNVLATRRVLALGEHCHMPRMRIAMVWIVPFIGAGMTLVDTLPDVRWMRAEAAEPPVHVQEPAPDEVPAMGVEAFPLLRHMQAVNGYPTVDWRAAEAWLTSIADGAGRVAARVDLHRAWLEHLCDALGEHAWLHESDDALIVSSLETPVAAAMGRYVASTRKRVAQTLGALAQFPDGVKSVVLVLDDEESYYHYISMFGPAEGEQAFSGGVFVDAGCPHFVVRRDDLSAIEPTIAHELTHSALSHLRLPLWVDEGLAVNTEHRIAGAHRGQFTARELHDKHVAFWDGERIQQFWTGASFRRPDDGNLLSYDLARIMVAQMGRAWPAFERFARAARRVDAGADAAREHLDLDLGAYVSLLFGHEPSAAWTPGAPAGPA
ncbi:MAG TPA: hypothetical protein VIN75_13690 [Burkholderiaceae bacterium]